MEFRDVLPPRCPPEEAQEITAETELFRLVKNDPPTAADFLSWQTLYPNRSFASNPCQACGLSVLRTHYDCVAYLKLPNLRGSRICRIRLARGHGRLQQTGKLPHHTWWPHRAFNHAASCEVIAA
jgi:hypothetical protein